MRRELSEEQLIEVTELSKEQIEGFRKNGMPFSEQKEAFFYPTSAITWIVKNHLDIDILKKESSEDIVLRAMKKGFSLDEIQ